MCAFAAVMTGQGVGAISSIQVLGDSAETVIKKIFKPAGKKPVVFQPGKILLGIITTDTEIIDQVTIGCEGPESCAINCHGNPLIVADIMKLLAAHGVELIDNEQMLAKILAGQGLTNKIELEAKLAQLSAKTIEGTKVLANQITAGLSKKVTEWLDNINTISLKQIKADACTILENSRPAKLIIHGCKTAIVGPPNTGKSTLLNCLAGREKAIVTDIRGTTRDWITAHCQTGPLALELIDTAGVDEKLASAPENIVEKKSQEGTAQILEQADLVLLVLDNSQTADQLDRKLLEKITGKKVLAVLNKSDLAATFDIGKLPQHLGQFVQISAKCGTGIENLLTGIRRITGASDFDLHLAVCINDRQKDLLKRLKAVKSKRQAVSLITELLNSPVRV